MKTVEQMCDALGRKELRDELGVSKAAISNVISAGFFPSNWYGIVKRMCQSADIKCPDELFSFRKPRQEVKSDLTAAE